MEFKSIASSSAGNAYLATEEGSAPLLIDPGIRFNALLPALGHDTAGLAGCLVSHQHGDHAQSAHNLAARGVPIYTSAECAAAIGIIWHGVTYLDHNEAVWIQGWRVLPWEAVHDVRCLGFAIESRRGDRLLYCTDSAYIPYRFSRLTHLAIAANYSEAILAERVASGAMNPTHGERVLKCHMSIERVLTFLSVNDLSQLREIHLLHLSDGNSDEAAFAEAVRRAAGVPVYVAAANTRRD